MSRLLCSPKCSRSLWASHKYDSTALYDMNVMCDLMFWHIKSDSLLSLKGYIVLLDHMN